MITRTSRVALTLEREAFEAQREADYIAWLAQMGASQVDHDLAAALARDAAWLLTAARVLLDLRAEYLRIETEQASRGRRPSRLPSPMGAK